MKQLLGFFVIALVLLPSPISRTVIGQDNTEQARSANPPLRYQLPDVDGGQHSERDWRQSKAAVFFFIATECPISNRYAPEVNRIVADYGSKGIAFFAVQSDPDLQAEEARKHSQQFGYQFPVLLDPEQNLAYRLRVVSTPTAVIVSPKGVILYQGRIDNRYLDFGKYRDAGIKPDLRFALDTVIAGKPVAEPFTKSIGCILPPLRKEQTHRHLR